MRAFSTPTCPPCTARAKRARGRSWWRACTTFSFAALLDRPDIWRGDSLNRVGTPTVACGFPELDAELPGGGWPAGALTEILPAHEGIGELRLLGPALAGLSQLGLRLAWIAPPHL